jgi:hypothetical protein
LVLFKLFYNSTGLSSPSLACYPYKEWLATYHHPIGSAAEAGYKTKIDMLRSAEQNQDIIHVAVIVGADRAMNKTGRAKWHKNASHITMCIGRKGETSRIIEQFKKDQDSNKVNNSRFTKIYLSWTHVCG